MDFDFAMYIHIDISYQVSIFNVYIYIHRFVHIYIYKYVFMHIYIYSFISTTYDVYQLIPPKEGVHLSSCAKALHSFGSEPLRRRRMRRWPTGEAGEDVLNGFICR
jgi:hypothetical protein